MKTTKAQQAARGQDCTLRIPLTCNFDPATTVLAHVGRHGTAKRRYDTEAIFACSDCHSAIDGATERFWSHDPELNKELREERERFIAQAKRRMKHLAGEEPS